MGQLMRFSCVKFFFNSLPLGRIFLRFWRMLLFSKSGFSKNSFRNTIRVSNSLDPDQARHFVGPDLVPICLQRLSADNTRSKRQRNELNMIHSYLEGLKA